MGDPIRPSFERARNGHKIHDSLRFGTDRIRLRQLSALIVRADGWAGGWTDGQVE